MNCVIVTRSLTEYLLKGSFHEKSFLKEIRNRNGKLTFCLPQNHVNSDWASRSMSLIQKNTTYLSNLLTGN